MNARFIFLLAWFASVATSALYAGSAQWNLSPTSGDWDTATNWTPNTVPNGPLDTATFDVSNTTSIIIGSSVASSTEVNGIVFNAGASAFSIRVGPLRGVRLTISGVGITNNSGIAQNFNVGGDSGGLHFVNNATAGSQVVFGINGAGAGGGSSTFSDNSSADHGTFNFTGGSALMEFHDNSTAGHGTFNLAGNNIGFSSLYFYANSSADHGTFNLAGGGGVPFVYGSNVFFLGNSTAANGIFTNNGAVLGGVDGPGNTRFADNSTAGNSTLIANGGIGGGRGGTIFFGGDSTGGTARVEVFGNGNLDTSGHNAPGVTVGSIEGSGNVFLGGNTLTVGSNMSTVFSGVLQDGGDNGFNTNTGGGLTKIGTGTLNLTGVNTYTGNTNINGGVLKVDGSITSNTFVNLGGTLAGTGTIHGNVTNIAGTVSPGDSPGTLTITGNFTQQSGTLVIDIAGASAGQFSVLNIFGTASLGGLLDPVLLNGFVPTIGESFTFLNYGAVTGSLFIFDRNIANTIEHWEVTYQSTNAILTVAAGNVPVPDRGSTFLLLTLGGLGLGGFRLVLLRKIRCS